MCKTYEEALKAAEFHNQRHPVCGATYIVEKDGVYTAAYGLEELEYAKMLGWKLATK